MNSTLSFGNLENSEQVLNSNITQEQKNSLMLDYIKDSRINSNTEPFERLLSLGVSPDLTNAQGKSILMMAAEKGSLVLVQHLIEEAKADIQMRDSHNKTALSYALEAGTENADVVTCLLSFNANPNIQSNDGKTPLIMAVERGYHTSAEALLYRGSNPNYIIPRTGDNALHIAARRGDERMVGLLLQYNCDVNKKNKKNETGLELCLNNPRLKDLVQHKLPQQPTKIVTSNVESSPINNMKDVANAIEQFRQVMHQNQALEDTHEGAPEENFQETGQTQSQDQTNDTLKPPTAKPDYRRYSQQQQQQQAQPQNFAQQQKRASQTLPSKVEREPPKRKYPGRGEALNIKRANSNTETAQTEASENTSTTNPLESPSTMSNMTSSPQRTMGRGVESESSANRHPQYRFPGDENPPYINDPAQSNSNIQSQYHQQQQAEDPNMMMIPNQQYNRQQQQQNKRMLNVQNQNPNQGEYQVQSGEYPDQFSPKPQQIQGIYVNNPPPQMNQMRFNDPSQQMKGNMSPGFYNNQQFLINSPNMDMNANPQQQPNKRKPKGQMSHTLNPTNPGNKNFAGPGSVPFPTGSGQNPNLNLNLNINQMQGQHQLPHQNFAQSPNIPYNQRNMEGRQVPVPGLDPQQQRIQGNKFNRNPERSFTDNPSQRGSLGSPNAGGFQPSVKNISNMPNIPEMGGGEGIKGGQNDGEKAPENIKMVKGGRPQQQQQYQQQYQQHQQYQQQKYQQQQQQGNMPPNLNGPGGPGGSNIMFTPNSPYTDQRGMINSPQGPNPGMFNVNAVPPHFVPHQQQMVNMSMMPPNLGPNMGGPNHFNAVNFSSPGLPMNRNQQQQQMMGKQQGMQPMFVFPNGIQRNMSMGSEPPMYYINLTDPIQKENSELQANYQSMCKEMTRQMKDIDKTNIENSELTKNLNECQLNEKSLQERIKEREKVIEELRKKNEELEIVVKTLTANSPFANRQDSTTVTDPLLGGYEVNPAERVLDEHDVVTEFWKHEALAAALCEEVMAFEKSVDEYFEEKKPQFDNLIKLMQGAVREVAADAEFYVYGSFATGLSLPWSDIDIVIKLPQTYYSYTVLDSIENNLKKKKWVEDVKIIKNASIPVLKINCTKQYHNKKIDISIQENKHNGLLCVELVKDYLNMYPPVRPLVLILKQFLYHLNLNDTYIGGLSSYALILMIVYLIQTKEMQNIANPGATQNLGSLLISFLQTYGFEYDYYNQFLVNPRKIMKQTEAGPDMYFENMSLMNIVHQNPPSIMEPKIIIQDPLSSMNNVGRSTFQIKQIKNAFMAAYFEAFKPCICEVHKYVQDLDSPESKKMIHKCTSIFKRMLSAYPPLK